MSGLEHEFPDIAELSREELEGEVVALRRTINRMRDDCACGDETRPGLHVKGYGVTCDLDFPGEP